MPSIRVKRSYATIHDTLSDQELLDPTRPSLPGRARSWTNIFGGNSSAVLSSPRPSAQPHTRPRSHTVSGVPPSQDAAGNSSLRVPSRVRMHILNPSRMSATPLQEHTEPSSFIRQVRRSLSSSHHSDRSDMISLEGYNEDVLIPEDPGHEPGRIGRALSISSSQQDDPFEEHHHDDIVEHLDVIDPQIATVSTLTNAANSIVFPPLSFYSRKPVVVLPETPRLPATGADAEKGVQPSQDNLDRHVKDVLTKRDKFRRVMRGVWSYMKTPMGIVVSIYGFLVVFWGCGIVFFLARFINFHNSNTQGFWVEVCQQVETGLFSIPSIGLIPFRTLDTWRICWIWHYKRKTRKLRKEAGLPELYDPDDLPDPVYDENYVHVLTDEEQADLHYQQHKFAQSQTWYRPHGTQTHRAFPIYTALLICGLNDLNSIFQILLSGTMWGLNRFRRPAWTTATTLPAAFVAGIAAGFYIYWGGRKTKRHEQVEERLRSALEMDDPPPNPAITFTPAVGDSETQPVHESGDAQQQQSPTSTTDSTPTILAPEVHSVDFTGRDDPETLLQQQDRVDSSTSIVVPIADWMTVPSAKDLFGSDVAVQGHER
ncbi:unnamed protein product [Somion occarium]|uniref:Uncharacterized protein n=1 Tax=Somion occarium TaxID=3059160 RepID=A0ABP1D254_9APHY